MTAKSIRGHAASDGPIGGLQTIRSIDLKGGSICAPTSEQDYDNVFDPFENRQRGAGRTSSGRRCGSGAEAEGRRCSRPQGRGGIALVSRRA